MTEPLRSMNVRRAAMIWASLAVVVLVVLVASLAIGSVALPVSRALGALLHARTAAPDIADDIVLTLRLPRALAGFTSGALLALGGALLQVLLRNPLAEPYVLGVSGGAAAFAFAAMLVAAPWWTVDLAAGAFLSIVLVLGLARRDLHRGEHDASPRLLLTGVVIAAGWSALITLILSLAPENRLRGMVFWLTGDLNGAQSPWPALVVLLDRVDRDDARRAATERAVARRCHRACAIGVPVARLRVRVYLVASIAAAVTTVGTIGFVGFVVPHCLRFAFGNDQRMLVPASALGGGLAVRSADLAARTVIAPAQLPVGVVTALIGVPVFLWMLLKRPR